jgi:hypothetical protein
MASGVVFLILNLEKGITIVFDIGILFKRFHKKRLNIVFGYSVSLLFEE